jgi:CBS domain-containing protein
LRDHRRNLARLGGSIVAPVVDGACALIGIVSAKDIVRWVVEHDAFAVRRTASGGAPCWRPLEG